MVNSEMKMSHSFQMRQMKDNRRSNIESAVSCQIAELFEALLTMIARSDAAPKKKTLIMKLFVGKKLRSS